MVVYNTSNSLDGPGVYVWDGSRWILITCVPETPGTIDLSPTAVNLNGTFTASVPEATGPAAPTAYAWTLPIGLNGTSTTRTITITGATAGTYNSGTIKVAATNACGTSAEQTSAKAVTVRDCSGAPATPTLTVTARTINRTGTTTLSCTDVGNGATTYAWTLPTGLTGSSTTNTITVTGATAGTYAANTIKVTATNACGNTTATGSGGAITVRDCTGAPTVSSPTSDQTPYSQLAGATYTMTVSANVYSASSVTYQWQSSTTGGADESEWNNVAATTNIYNAPTAVLGTTYYRCRVTTTCGEAVSPKWKIMVIECPGAPTVSSPATDETKITKQGVALPADLSVTANVYSGAADYQWQSSADRSTWDDIDDETAGDNFTAPVNVAGTTYYRCVVTTGCGSAMSEIFTVIVCSTAESDDEGNWYCTGNFGDAGTWMTMNLRSTQNNVYTNLEENVNSSDANSAYYYYPNKSQSTFTSHPEYGLLYTWAAATGRTGVTGNEENSSHGPHQGICPDGWHLPSDLEWTRLTDVISASTDGAYSTTTGTGNSSTKMKSTTVVNGYATGGTSKSRTANGFDALLVGYMYSDSPGNYGTYTFFWSSSSSSSTIAWYRSLDYLDPRAYKSYYGKYRMYSVRCKKTE
jgi:uncharacterized protein (TIGR02145 family)